MSTKTIRTNDAARWLRAGVLGRVEAVDRAAQVLRGYVVAQEGPFKSDGRGEFDKPALQAIVKMGNAARKGLKSRFGHPTLSEDGLGKYLGRGQNFRMGTALDARTNKSVAAVRADLHFDPTASDTPHGNLADYVLNLAESDPEAISSSLVLEADEEYRLEKDGTATTGPDGEPLPPLWRPTALHASDIVDTGDAVDGLLSAGELAQALSVGLTPDLQKLLRFDNVARLSAQLLDGMFPSAGREEVERRCQAWLRRYLAFRFPGDEEGLGARGQGLDQESGLTPNPSPLTPLLDKRSGRLKRLAQRVRQLFTHNSETVDNEPEWGGVDKTELPRLAFADPGEPEMKSTWGFPHHWVQGGNAHDDNGVLTDGTLYLHRGGLNAAWSAANGGRSGEKASSEVIAHLRAHRRALGLE